MSELERMYCLNRYHGEEGYEGLIRALAECDRKGLTVMISEKARPLREKDELTEALAL